MDLDEIGHGQSIGVREQPREVAIRKFWTVAMVIGKKYSRSLDIGLMVMDFGMWSLLYDINLPAENEQNLPSRFRDRPIATAW